MKEEILLTPGPTMVDPRVTQILSSPQISHMGKEMYEAFVETIELTKYLFGGGEPILITGSGTVGMEASVISLIEPGDNVIVYATGYFGERFSEINRIHGANVTEIKPEIGGAAKPEILKQELEKGDYKAVFMTHVETSTGVENPINELVKVSKENNAYTVVDTVAGIAGCKINFDELNADIVLTGSQKAIASIPGVAVLAISKQAIEAFESRKTPINSYYMNLLRWKKIMDNPKRYLATPSVQSIFALRESLKIIKEEGLENRWKRHEIIADAFRSGVTSIGCNIVAEEGYRANTVTAFYTHRDNAVELQKMMLNKFGVHLSTALGELRDKALRIGHFGNVTAKEVIAALTALEMCLRLDGSNIEAGTALKHATPILERINE